MSFDQDWVSEMLRRAEPLTFFGRPVLDLTREELIAAVVLDSRQVEGRVMPPKGSAHIGFVPPKPPLEQPQCFNDAVEALITARLERRDNMLESINLWKFAKPYAKQPAKPLE